jgi:spectinomycin phosphotransferase
VKWSGGGSDAGPLSTAYLASRGVQGVPAPVPTLTGGLWSEREGRRLSVMPWITGERASDTGLTLDQWTSYGALLAAVHRAAPPAELQAALPPINPINSRMPALTRSVRARLTTPADPVAEELAAVWEAHDDLITAVLEQCADLSGHDLGGTAVLCHADPHLANVLITPGQLHLIDWDDVVLAPVEQDLMFFLGGMGPIGPTTDAEEKAFFTGYGPVDLDPTRLRYYRSARAVEDFAGWSDYVLTDAPDRQDRLNVVKFILGPNGLAVRALA